MTDVLVDANAVREGNTLHVPVVGVCDTNADPTTISHPIPANDDAVKSIQLITSYIVQAVSEGKSRAPKEKPADAAATKKADKKEAEEK